MHLYLTHNLFITSSLPAQSIGVAQPHQIEITTFPNDDFIPHRFPAYNSPANDPNFPTPPPHSEQDSDFYRKKPLPAEHTLKQRNKCPPIKKEFVPTAIPPRLKGLIKGGYWELGYLLLRCPLVHPALMEDFSYSIWDLFSCFMEE